MFVNGVMSGMRQWAGKDQRPNQGQGGGMWRGPAYSDQSYQKNQWRGWNEPRFGGRPHQFGFGNWMQQNQFPQVFGSTWQGQGGGIPNGLARVNGDSQGNRSGRYAPGLAGGVLNTGAIRNNALAGMMGAPSSNYQGFLDNLQAQRMQAMGAPQMAPQGGMHPSAIRPGQDSLRALMG